MAVHYQMLFRQDPLAQRIVYQPQRLLNRVVKRKREHGNVGDRMQRI
jgi:hypothetical protein